VLTFSDKNPIFDIFKHKKSLAKYLESLISTYGGGSKNLTHTRGFKVLFSQKKWSLKGSFRGFWSIYLHIILIVVKAIYSIIFYYYAI